MSDATPEPQPVKPVVLGYGHRDPQLRRIARRIPRLRWRTCLLILLTGLLVWWFVKEEPAWLPRLLAHSNPGSNVYQSIYRLPTRSPDGTKVAFNLDRTLMVFDAATDRELLSLPDPSLSLEIDFPKVGSRAMASSWGGFGGFLVDLITQQKTTLADKGIMRPYFSSDGTRLVTTGLDDGGTLWDPRNGAKIAPFTMPGIFYSDLDQVVITPDQRLVEMVYKDQVIFFRMSDGILDHQVNFQPYVEPTMVNGRFPGWAAATPDGLSVAWCDLTDSVFVTDTQSGQNRVSLKFPGVSKGGTLITRDGKRILLSINGQWTFVNLATGAIITTGPPWPAGMSMPQFNVGSFFEQSPDGRFIVRDGYSPATPSQPASARTCVFDAQTLRPVGVLPGNFSRLQPFSPDCRHLVLMHNNPSNPTGKDDLTVWDTSTWNCTATLFFGALGSVTWLNDRSFLTISRENGVNIAQIWTRHRPEAWYGVAVLPQFWLALFAALFCLYRIRCDLRLWYHPLLPAGVPGNG